MSSASRFIETPQRPASNRKSSCVSGFSKRSVNFVVSMIRKFSRTGTHAVNPAICRHSIPRRRGLVA